MKLEQGQKPQVNWLEQKNHIYHAANPALGSHLQRTDIHQGSEGNRNKLAILNDYGARALFTAAWPPRLAEHLAEHLEAGQIASSCRLAFCTPLNHHPARM